MMDPPPPSRITGKQRSIDQYAAQNAMWSPCSICSSVEWSKLGILKALLDSSIAGDDQPIAVEERPELAEHFAEPDPQQIIAGFAGITTAINQRTNDVYACS